MIDLTSSDFSIIQEVSRANIFFDIQKYVMNGVNPNSFTNMSSNYLNAYLSRFITRMFNELDLAELQRVQKFKTAQSLNG